MGSCICDGPMCASERACTRVCACVFRVIDTHCCGTRRHMQHEAYNKLRVVYKLTPGINAATRYTESKTTNIGFKVNDFHTIVNRLFDPSVYRNFVNGAERDLGAKHAPV